MPPSLEDPVWEISENDKLTPYPAACHYYYNNNLVYHDITTNSDLGTFQLISYFSIDYIDFQLISDVIQKQLTDDNYHDVK